MSAWLIAGCVLAAAVVGYVLWRVFRKPDAYIYVPEGVAIAEWQYKQLPMRECKFCGSGVNLNRHHVISQLACPERKNDPKNLIVLCRSCHQVVGHKNNWKKFNPYVAEICEKYGGPPVDSKEWRRQHEVHAIQSSVAVYARTRQTSIRNMAERIRDCRYAEGNIPDGSIRHP